MQAEQNQGISRRKGGKPKGRREKREKVGINLSLFCESPSEANMFLSGIEHLLISKESLWLPAFLLHAEELLKNSKHASLKHSGARLI